MKRTGYIALLAASIISAACVKEETKEDFFNIDETEVVLTDYYAGAKDILLATNTEPTVELSSDWLTAEITSRCLTLTYKENTSEDDRTVEVHIVAGSIPATVTVTQPGHKNRTRTGTRAGTGTTLQAPRCLVSERNRGRYCVLGSRGRTISTCRKP